MRELGRVARSPPGTRRNRSHSSHALRLRSSRVIAVAPVPRLRVAGLFPPRRRIHASRRAGFPASTASSRHFQKQSAFANPISFNQVRCCSTATSWFDGSSSSGAHAERGQEFVVQRRRSVTQRARRSRSVHPGARSRTPRRRARAGAPARSGGSRSSTRRRRRCRARRAAARRDRGGRSRRARRRAKRSRAWRSISSPKSRPTPVAPGRAASTSASVTPSPVPRSSTRSTRSGNSSHSTSSASTRCGSDLALAQVRRARALR